MRQLFPSSVGGLHIFGKLHDVCMYVVNAIHVVTAVLSQCRIETTDSVSKASFLISDSELSKSLTWLPVHARTSN